MHCRRSRGLGKKFKLIKDFQNSLFESFKVSSVVTSFDQYEIRILKRCENI